MGFQKRDPESSHLQLKKKNDPVRFVHHQHLSIISICEMFISFFSFRRDGYLAIDVLTMFIGTLRNHERARLLYAVRLSFKALRFRYAI